MAFTSAEKVQIRKYLGAPAPFNALTIRLDTLIAAVEGDAATVTEVQTWIAALALIQTSVSALRDQMQITEATGDAKLDCLRAQMGLFKEGRYYVGLLAQTLTFPPLRDVFTPHRMGSWAQVSGLP